MKFNIFHLIILPLVLTEQNQDISQITTPSYEISESQNRQSIVKLPKKKKSDLECEAKWRLPRNVLPTHYQLNVKIAENDPVFNGSVAINIRCMQDTDEITLHSKHLDITSTTISIRPKLGFNITVVNITEDKETEMVHLKLTAALKSNNTYMMDIPNYSGKIRHDEKGLFHKTYHVNKEKKKTVFTQFEPTYARLVFPCFDEPNMKAYFSVGIERPAAWKAFSNMPIKNTTAVLQDRVLDTFEESLLMPTYLLSFVVGDLYRYPSNENDRTRIVVPEKDIGKVDFSYRLAVDALRELESYTKIPQPLRKIDHIAVPEFSTEAMENWGLITYDSEILVEDENIEALKKQTLTLVAHELTHFYFGNLVTTEWWSSLWLNEGFAAYFEHFITDKILPEWKTLDYFIVNRFQPALKADAKPGKLTPAMTSKVCSPDEISSRFDDISYNKAASVLRMFKSVFGDEEIFQGALRLYLQRRAFDSAKPSDLFTVLDEINFKLNESPLPNNVTFTDLAVDWTEQAGVPVVTVTRDYTSSSVHLKQDHFYDVRSFNETKEDNEDSRWWIPLTWVTASSPASPLWKRPQDWLYDDKTVRVIVPKTEWLLLNPHSTGYYRINYDDKNWALLAQGLKSFRTDFPVTNRAQLLDDAFALGFAHQLDLGIAMNLTQFLQDEDDVYMWISADDTFLQLYDLLGSTSAYPKFEKYVQKLMKEIYRKVRLDIVPKEPQRQRLLRYTVANVACLVGLDLCLVDSHFALLQFLADSTSNNESPGLHPDVKMAVICGGIQSGGRSIFEQVRNLALIDNENNDDSMYLLGLSCTRDNNLFTWHLDDIISNSTNLTHHHAMVVLETAIRTPLTFSVTTQFVRNNVNKINHYFNCTTDYVEKVVKAICEEIRTNEHYDEIYGWILSSNGDELGNKTNLLDYLEKLRPKIEWSSETVQQIEDWLNAPSVHLPQPISSFSPKCSKSSSIIIMLMCMLVCLRIAL